MTMRQTLKRGFQALLVSGGLYPRWARVSTENSAWSFFANNIKLQKRFLEWRFLRGADRAGLEQLRNLHLGRRCFVIGNGPSLNKMDLRLLSNEITIGSNALFLNEPKMGFLPSYYTVQDSLVAEDRSKELDCLRDTLKVFPVDLLYALARTENTMNLAYIPSPKDGVGFSKNLIDGVHSGFTVTYLNLQLAFFLGCREVYLIGMDHSYRYNDSFDRKKGRLNGKDELISQSEDPNHFHPDYFGKGYRWHDPNLEGMEQAYRVARRVFEEDQRVIKNATIGGHLEVFDRTNFDSLFLPVS